MITKGAEQGLLATASRRGFLGRVFGMGLAGLGLGAAGVGCAAWGASRRPLRVLVWDERQPAQKQAYREGLGVRVARHLRGCKGVEVTDTMLRSSSGLSARSTASGRRTHMDSRV